MATNRWISAAFPCNGQIAFCRKNSHPLCQMQFFLFKCHQSLQKCTQMEFKNCYKVNINEMRKKKHNLLSNKAETYVWYRTPLINKKYSAIITAWFLCQVPQPAIFASNVELTSEGDLLGHLQSGEWKFVLHSIVKSSSQIDFVDVVIISRTLS